ncbi:hypothetical protein H6F88_32090 [Oculatella sp. FACHB-28]|nr:hypothetical protein [Oculatella sp. FACHB-28]
MPLAIAPFLIGINPSFAVPVVRPISQSIAQGLSGSGASVTVWAGSGTNIDFTRTGEVIQRVWIDDPHAVTVDFDAPLDGQGGANIVHLRRVTGFHFPNLPETPTTLLTVVTQSAAGRKTYLFEVRYGSGTPQYATLAVTPDSEASGGVAISHNRTANWNDVERGLERAIAQGLISSTSPVTLRVQNFITLVRNGMPMQQAISEANISVAVISRLAEMGFPLTLPSPSEPAQSSVTSTQ